MKRVMVVANKWWEADPLCGVFIHDKARPGGFTDFAYVRYPTQRAVSPFPGAPRPVDPPAIPRMTFRVEDAAVEVWCLEELMNPAESSSSSLEKARVLPAAITADASPDLIIAFGTAGTREGISINGCVVVGHRVFIHDPWTGNEPSPRWHPPFPDKVIESPPSSSILRKIREEYRAAAEARFFTAPVVPVNPTLIFSGDGFVSLGVVNITKYEDYSWADASAIAAFKSAKIHGQIGSIETTHGIIRSLSSDRPFLYISGITDTEGLFDFQVTPRAYSQNTVAAHNAAVALAWFLPDLIGSLP